MRSIIAMRGKRRGALLLEATLTVMVMGCALVVFAASFPMASRRVYSARHTDLATNACNNQLDLYRNAGYASCPTIPNGASSTQVSFTPPSDLSNATGTLRFTRVDGSYSATTTDTGRLQVDATVTWNAARNDKGTVTLTTLILK